MSVAAPSPSVSAPASTPIAGFPWLVVAGGVALVGAAAGARPLLALGAVLVAVWLVFAAPEFLLALLLVIGGIKNAPAVQALPIDATALTAAALGVGILVRAVRGRIRFIPWLATLPLVLAALVTASALWSPASSVGLSEALRFQGLTLLAFYAPLFLLRDRHDVVRLMIGVVLFAMVVNALSVHTDHANKPLVVVGGNSGGEIELALDCAVGLFAAGYLAAQRQLYLRLPALVCMFFLASTLLQAGSRGILVGALLALGFLIVVNAQNWLRPSRLAIAVAFVALTLGAGVLSDSQAISRYESQLFSTDASTVLGQRSYIYEQGLRLAAAEPFGLGGGGFAAETGLVYPHNVELELADEQGLPAVLLFLIIVGLAWRARRTAFRQGLRAESATAGALIIALFVDAQVSHGLNDSRAMWFAFGLAMTLPFLRAASRR